MAFRDAFMSQLDGEIFEFSFIPKRTGGFRGNCFEIAS